MTDKVFVLAISNKKDKTLIACSNERSLLVAGEHWFSDHRSLEVSVVDKIVTLYNNKINTTLQLIKSSYQPVEKCSRCSEHFAVYDENDYEQHDCCDWCADCKKWICYSCGFIEVCEVCYKMDHTYSEALCYQCMNYNHTCDD